MPIPRADYVGRCLTQLRIRLQRPLGYVNVKSRLKPMAPFCNNKGNSYVTGKQIPRTMGMLAN